ncbi:PIG-L family deacetylase [Acidithrix ferrooxidans]|uniref:Mycothiol S-conjugate amidase n=1 Tax=Acidithrix ferrooxidans TaxID=1280514 RepID=A0A0D8HL22_9ACTN|nr:PIG-L family deacetylase [Acidithrix ferrooxidans]KJF17791.1 mycothiol S-conjugate amidase [Acidithrix ferrooxidans]
MNKTIISIHAHPDDESSKGAAIIARYVSEGARAVLITATGGEEGDIINPAMKTDYVRANLAMIRSQELDEAVKIIGYHRLVKLGYRDSGMVGTPANENPSCFAMVPIDEAASVVARVIRQERPSVMLTYPEIQSRYPHPDHVRVYHLSMRAMELASDPAFEPQGDAPHEIEKVYYHIWTKERILAIHEKFIELGLESPFTSGWFEDAIQDYLATTKIALKGFSQIRRDALLAHRTQIDPNSPFWFGLDVDDELDAYPTEDLYLARGPVGYEFVGIEDDLFGGL